MINAATLELRQASAAVAAQQQRRAAPAAAQCSSGACANHQSTMPWRRIRPLQGRRASRRAGASPCLRCSATNTQEPAGPPPPRRRASQWGRFVGFAAAGNAKEAWLSISASVLQVTLPAALLAAALHGSDPPAAVAAAEAAAFAGAAIAGGTEVWKVLEGFQG